METRINIGEKMRKQLKLWAAAAAVCLVAPFASADFSISSVRTPGTGANANFDQIKFYALNDGENGTGKALIGVASTMTTDSHFIFRMANLDEDNVLDADIMMTEGPTFKYSTGDPDNPTARSTSPFSFSAGSSNTGTAIRPRGTPDSIANWNAQVFIPNTPTSTPTVTKDADGFILTATPTTTPNYNNTNINSFRVEGVYLGPTFAPLADATATANAANGKGALFAVALVPKGASVTLPAPQLAGEIGPTLTLANYTDAVPEPATLGLLSLGGMAILGRRRRKA